MMTRVLLEIGAASVLVWMGRRCWTQAEEFCRRSEYSERIRQPWRSLLYPRWFWAIDECVFRMRATGVASFVMAALLLVVAAMTLFSGHS